MRVSGTAKSAELTSKQHPGEWYRDKNNTGVPFDRDPGMVPGGLNSRSRIASKAWVSGWLDLGLQRIHSKHRDSSINSRIGEFNIQSFVARSAFEFGWRLVGKNASMVDDGDGIGKLIGCLPLPAVYRTFW